MESLFFFVLFIRSVTSSAVFQCKNALGMFSQEIATEQMIASTMSNRVENARLNSSQGWRANEDDTNPWFQVSFQQPVYVSGLATQGNGRDKENEYIREYKIGYSLDGVEWKNITDEGGLDMIFHGHDEFTDRNQPVRHQFWPIELQYITIYALLWEGMRCALRFEMYGCDGLPPYFPTTTTITTVRPTTHSASPSSYSTSDATLALQMETVTPTYSMMSEPNRTRKRKNIPKGIIVAVVSGTLILLITLLVVGICLRKRKRSNPKKVDPRTQFANGQYEPTVPVNAVSPMTVVGSNGANMFGKDAIFQGVTDGTITEDPTYSSGDGLVDIYAVSPTTKHHDGEYEDLLESPNTPHHNRLESKQSVNEYETLRRDDVEMQPTNKTNTRNPDGYLSLDYKDESDKVNKSGPAYEDVVTKKENGNTSCVEVDARETSRDTAGKASNPDGYVSVDYNDKAHKTKKSRHAYEEVADDFQENDKTSRVQEEAQGSNASVTGKPKHSYEVVFPNDSDSDDDETVEMKPTRTNKTNNPDGYVSVDYKDNSGKDQKSGHAYEDVIDGSVGKTKHSYEVVYPNDSDSDDESHNQNGDCEKRGGLSAGSRQTRSNDNSAITQEEPHARDGMVDWSKNSIYNGGDNDDEGWKNNSIYGH